MNILPNELVLLDENLQRIGAAKRLDATGEIAGHRLAESAYDKLIIDGADAIADALREAAVISQRSTLRYLGRQILSVDVLFAEVEREGGTFLRFVIAEDKLFRNPEARREVLGQILDYALRLRELDVEGLSEFLPDEQRAWLDENDALVEQALRKADFLLLICGDRIRPRVFEYIKYLKEQRDPLSSIDVALLSLAIFSNGVYHILVPHIVALVIAEQGIAIRVVVETSNGERLPASVSIDKGTTQDVRRGTIELEQLIADIKNAGGESAVRVAESLLDYAKNLGAEVMPRAASVSIRVKDPSTGRHSTIFVVTRLATFYIQWHKNWTSNSGVGPEVAQNYERRLKEILGRSPVGRATGGAYAVPLVDIEKNLEPVLGEIRSAIAALRYMEK